MLLMSGTEVSRVRLAKLKERVAEFQQKHRRRPGLAVVLVGDNPASHVYVRNKMKACADVGMASFDHKIPADTPVGQILSLLAQLNKDSAVDGILVQLPLPKHLDSLNVMEALSPIKDADGLTYENMGRLVAGRSQVAACTPKGVMSILEHYKIPVAGCRAVVVGRSQIVGKPMSQLLINADATGTICHSKTADLLSETRSADLVIVAAGQRHFLGREAFRKGAVVVDVGMHRLQDGKLCGDVRMDELTDWVSAVTPVPGGVGPMTITSLLENTFTLAEMHET